MDGAKLIFWKKGRFFTSSGKIIIIEMDIWLVPETKRYLYPNGLKFGWTACNRDNPKERVLVDYNLKKGFHYHLNQEPVVKLEWISLEKTLNLFYQKVHEKFGDII